MCGLGNIGARNVAPGTAGIGDPGVLAFQNHIHILTVLILPVRIENLLYLIMRETTILQKARLTRAFGKALG